MPKVNCEICKQNTNNRFVCDCCVQALRAIPRGTNHKSLFSHIIDWLDSPSLFQPITSWISVDGHTYTKVSWRTHPAVAALIPPTTVTPISIPILSTSATVLKECLFCKKETNSCLYNKTTPVCPHCIATLNRVGYGPATRTLWDAILHWRAGIQIDDWIGLDGKRWNVANYLNHPAIRTLSTGNLPAEPNKPNTNWNAKCPTCKSDAYIGFTKIECSNSGCKG